MTQRGEGGRALGASLAASAVGGVLGAVFLAALIPVVGPIVLAFGPAEYFFLALLGLTFVGAVSGGDLVKGVLVGALGLMLAFVGSEAQTGVQRFSLGQTFLWDGVDTITAVIAIFAIPECLAARGGGAIRVEPAVTQHALLVRGAVRRREGRGPSLGADAAHVVHRRGDRPHPGSAATSRPGCATATPSSPQRRRSASARVRWKA
jgi:TctA family transporter